MSYRGLGLALPLNPTGLHPAIVEVANDSGSILHVAFGFMCGMASPEVALGLSSLFAGYEVSKLQSGESGERTGGKFIELGVGILGAVLFKRYAR